VRKRASSSAVRKRASSPAVRKRASSPAVRNRKPDAKPVRSRSAKVGLTVLAGAITVAGGLLIGRIALQR
jgi:hypothetical protein